MKESEIRPSYYKQRARAMKMGNIVERELQIQRNKLMNGLGSSEPVSALWRNGQVIVKRGLYVVDNHT